MKVLYPHSWRSLGISIAERDLGISSHVLSRSETIGFIRFFIKSSKQKFNNSILELFKAFLKYRKSYDIYHFNFGSSLIDYFNFRINL